MVDGIIQKVFKQWYSESNKKYHQFNSCNFPIQTALQDLQPELIADIEKEYAPNDKLYSSGAIRKQLIGDNKS